MKTKERLGRQPISKTTKKTMKKHDVPEYHQKVPKTIFCQKSTNFQLLIKGGEHENE